MQFNNTLLLNNSLVNFEEITKGSHISCFTNTTKCCRYRETPGNSPEGVWHFPNGTEVSNESKFSVERDKSVVHLRYNGAPSISISGLYSCTIPSYFQNVTLYVGIYNKSAGK